MRKGARQLRGAPWARRGRSLFTQPIDAVAHDVGTRGQRHKPRSAHAHVASWTSSLDGFPVDALHAVEGDGEQANRTPINIPMLSEAQALDLERGDVVDAGGGREVGPQQLERLALVVDALRERAAGARPAAQPGSPRPHAPCPARRPSPRSAGSSLVSYAVSTGSTTSSRSQPVLLAARVGRVEVVERNRAVVGDEDPEPVEVAVHDPCVVEHVQPGPRRRRAPRRSHVRSGARQPGCRRAGW